MASAPDSTRWLSYLAFSTSSSDRKKKAPQHRPSTPHYRPVSSILSQAPTSCFEPRLSNDFPTMKVSIKDKTRVSFESQTIRKSSLPFRSNSPTQAHGNDSVSSRNIFSKLKMKRSMSALNRAAYNSQHTNDAAPSQPLSSFAMNLSAPDLRKPAVKKDKWIRKDYATFHPYPDEAPYMQAYDPIPLDKYAPFHMLIQCV
ncbi:hypothetical protein F5887DRAFT_71788 [Amanita rubescens]|nr:hypothetical protein F5887DRAFT_71788 [Amanita rubescens]